MTYVDGVAALSVLRGVTEPEAGLCLAAVWEAYHAEGAQSSVTYPTASSAFTASGGFHNGDYAPPAGYPVWFGTRADGEDSGDVGISVGNGNVVAVWDLGVHEVSIAARAAEINRPYLGWTENFMTDNIIVPGVGSNLTMRPTADVQTKVGVPPQDVDGVYGPQTTWYVRAFQASHGLTVDGIYGPLTDAALFGSAPMPGVHAEAVDFSYGRPGAAALISAGRPNAFRYVGAFDGDGRAIGAAELAEYMAAGVSVTLNYEGSGQDATSFANGVEDAKYAQDRVAALDHPEAVVYFSIDEQFASDPANYFKGVESVIGHARAGIYGSLDMLEAVHTAGLCSFYWLTYAWLQGRPVPDWVHVFQFSNGQTINGAAVDFDHCLQADWGQIGGGAPVVVPASSGSSGSVGSVTVLRAVTQIQSLVGAAQDGVYGPETTAKVQAWQGAHGLTADGIWGPLSDAAGFPGIAVDGAEGPETTKAEQAALGVTVDGIRGPETISAEQSRTGAGMDGVDGPDTTSHLQAYLNRVIGAGLTVDGVRGPLTVKALQTALNERKF